MSNFESKHLELVLLASSKIYKRYILWNCVQEGSRSKIPPLYLVTLKTGWGSKWQQEAVIRQGERITSIFSFRFVLIGRSVQVKEMNEHQRKPSQANRERRRKLHRDIFLWKKCLRQVDNFFRLQNRECIKRIEKYHFQKFLVARQHGVWLDWTSIWVAQSVLSHWTRQLDKVHTVLRFSSALWVVVVVRLCSMLRK